MTSINRNDIAGARTIEGSDALCITLATGPVAVVQPGSDRMREVQAWIDAGGVVEPAVGLDEYAQRKRTEINDSYEAELAPYQRSYPETEKRTWPYQREQARVWVEWDDGGRLGDEPATPDLDDIAATRQVDRETLIRKAHEKAVLFASVANPASGKRQRLEDQIDAVVADYDDGTIDADVARSALDAIQW